MLVALRQGSLVTQPVDVEMTCPEWSPNYDRFAYTERGSVYIYSMDEMTSTVVKTHFLELSAPAWSPDGNNIAFAARDSPTVRGLGIWFLDLSTQDIQLLIECATSPNLYDSCSSPVWLPDGRLSYVRHIYDPDLRTISSYIEILDPVSLDTEIIVTEPQIGRGGAPFGTEEQFYYGHFATLGWSPDGSRVAFTGGNLSTGDRNIYVLDTSDRTLIAVFPANTIADTPVWLDAMHLMFRSETRPEFWEEGTYKEAYNIGVIDIDSQQIMQLTDFAPIFGEGRNPVISCPFAIPKSVGDRITFQ
jgi:Tol biopolymer transport system component